MNKLVHGFGPNNMLAMRPWPTEDQIYSTNNIYQWPNTSNFIEMPTVSEIEKTITRPAIYLF